MTRRRHECVKADVQIERQPQTSRHTDSAARSPDFRLRPIRHWWHWAAATSRSFELSQAIFRAGSSDYLDVLDAQRSMYAAQQTLIGLQLTEQVNRIVIYKVLGGGWRTADGPDPTTPG